MKFLFALAVATFVAGQAYVIADEIKVGEIDQKMPEKKLLVAPEKETNTQMIDQIETVNGSVKKDEKRHVYVIVCPLVKDGEKTWWVQEQVSLDKEQWTAKSHFGDEETGKGVYFIVLAVATDKSWSVGETLTDLPENANYSKVKVVKRKKE